MYLIQIDSATSLIQMDPELTGWLAIPSFAKIYNSEKGIQKMTVIALFCDYLSPIRHYGENDRMAKSFDNVFGEGNRDNIFWAADEVQHAIGDYKTLQYNHVLEEKRILDDNKIKLLQQIQLESDETKKGPMMNQLKTVNKNMQDFDLANAGKDLYVESPVRNGYKLSRLENKLENNKSFYYSKKQHLEQFQTEKS